MGMSLNSKYKNVIKILKNGGVGVMPTDTLYGLVGSAFSKKAVNRIYKLKKRNKSKKFIILIASIKDLEKFGIKYPYKLEFVGMLKKVWPGKVSIIINNIAFRMPKNKKLLEILKQVGPLVAPSANLEDLKPAKNIKEAKEYFGPARNASSIADAGGDKVDFYLSGGTLKGKPSALIKINKNSEITVLRGSIKI